MTLYRNIPCSDGKKLAEIRVCKQNRNENAGPLRGIVGIDTETTRGNIFLIADSERNWLDGEYINFPRVAEFLLQHEGKWLFMYNLQYDAEGILKLLPKEVLKTYKRRRKWNRELRFEYQDYKVHYIPKKKLVISKGKHTVACYDIAQYYDNKPLVVAYKQNILKPLSDAYEQMKEKRRYFSSFYYSRHKKKVRDYCIQDCIMTAELAAKWVDTFNRMFGFYPQNWISAGYLAEKVLVHNGIEMPFFHDFEYWVQELAREAFVGGRFELIQRGYIGECYLYDINSAYPNALRHMPDMRHGRWIRGDKVNPDAQVGFFRIVADIDCSVKVAPFPFRQKDGSIIYPVGRFETTVTLDELRMIEGDKRIKYKIIESAQFIPYPDCSYPCKDFIEKLYYKRLELKKTNDPLERAIKVVLNSIYGKTAQRTNNIMGNMFCPVVASYITGYVRAHLYKFMRQHNLEQKDLVAFATDSVATRRKLSIADSDRLGEMKLDRAGKDVYYLSNGFYRFNAAWKLRGVGYDHEKKVEVENVSVRQSKDGQLYIGLVTTKTVHLRTGIRYNKLDDVNKIVEYEKRIDLNSDRKRFWNHDLTSLDEKSRCDSHALSMDVFGDLMAKSSENVKLSEEKEDNEREEEYEPESDL